MAVEWTEKLSVGHAEIDDQHRELFRRFNDLLEACRAQRGKEKVMELLLFLDDYVGTHFSAEEGFMRRQAYPGTAEHVAEHRHFLQQLAALKEDLRQRGPSLGLVVEINQALLQWIINHIKQRDVQVGAFLRAGAASRS